MKTKIFSIIVLFLAVLAVITGVAIDKKPIEAKKMSSAEVIEYVDDETLPTEGEQVEKEDEVCICVFGQSKVSLQPDCAKICANIESLDSDMSKSKENNLQAYQKVISALKELGASDDEITLEHFSCYPNYDYTKSRSIVGYYSNTNFCVSLCDLTKLDSYLNVLTDNGVTNICDINYQISNIDEEYNNTLSQAIENAKSKAIKILGRDDIKISSIKEETIYCNNYRSFSSQCPSSLVGKVDISARVLVEFK